VNRIGASFDGITGAGKNKTVTVSVPTQKKLLKPTVSSTLHRDWLSETIKKILEIASYSKPVFVSRTYEGRVLFWWNKTEKVWSSGASA